MITIYDYVVDGAGNAFNPAPGTPLKVLVDNACMVKREHNGVVVARLDLRDDVYVMENTGGLHRLAVACTDEERLAAHWDGFCQTSLAISEGRVYRHQA
jgi:hypothetical protein